MPPVPVVAIEIPAEVAPDLAAVLLRSCNLALGQGRCASASEPTVPRQFAWIASFYADAAQPTQLRVDLRNATPQVTFTRLTRTLDFDVIEGASHRWSTAGVVVAALVVSAESTSRDAGASAAGRDSASGATSTNPDERGPAAGEPAPTDAHPAVLAPGRPKDSAQNPDDPSTQESRAFRLDVGALLGTAVEEGTSRIGGRLRPSVELGQLAFLWSDFAVSESKQAAESWVWSGAVGMGFVTRNAEGRLGIEGRLGLRGDRVDFKAVDGSQTDRALRWRGGGVVGVDFTLKLARPLALWLGGEAALMSPRVNVNVGGNRVGQLGLLDGSLSAGLRWRLEFDSR